MDEPNMPQNYLRRNSDDDDTSLGIDKQPAYLLSRRLGVSLAHARVIAELLGCNGGLE
jgi:hypothetical protein